MLMHALHSLPVVVLIGLACTLVVVGLMKGIIGVGMAIVGLPLLPSGDEGEQAQRCRRFGEALTRATGLPVEYQDETLSSVTAEEARRELTVAGSRRRASVDDHAAARILQAYIDEREPGA